MPSLARALDAVGLVTVFATEKQNAKIIPTQIIVDNFAGGAERVIRIQDVFTTAASVVAATGAAVAGALQPAVDRLIITVDNGGWATIAAEALKKLEIFGQLQVATTTIAGVPVTDAGTIVTISWGFK